jgi:outer membrane protein OmpA-like peptidoglycan-associated protein
MNKYPLSVLLCCLLSMSCVSRERSRPNHARDDLSIYRITNDQAGHEYVKAEQFLVPVGSVIVIKGLEFESGSSTLTEMQKLIVQQIFNSLEEITENTVGDTNSARVAEYKKMEFEIRGSADDAGSPEANKALAEERAKAVLNFMTNLGTPPWRLKATGLVTNGRIASNSATKDARKPGRVEFIRRR